MMDFEKKERIKESGYVENKTQINLKALWIALLKMVQMEKFLNREPMKI